MVAGRIYRTALRCYPASFRRRYGDDLIVAFEDLCADRGSRVGSSRTIVDLIVTVPKYRLEYLMSEDRARVTLGMIILVIAAAGVATLSVGAWPVSLALVGVAVALFVSQRSRLAQSLNTGVPHLRRQLLIAGVVAALAFAGLIAVYLVDIGDNHVGDGALVVYNVAGLLCLVSAVVLAVAGLRTTRQAAAIHRR